MNFIEVFTFMPIGAIVGGEVFCVHSGISPSASTIDEIQNTNRVEQNYLEGIACDLCCCCPDDRTGWGLSLGRTSFTFGPDISKEFNEANGLKLIGRSYQLVMEGYLWMHERNVISVYSCPNFKYR